MPIFQGNKVHPFFPACLYPPPSYTKILFCTTGKDCTAVLQYAVPYQNKEDIDDSISRESVTKYRLTIVTLVFLRNGFKYRLYLHKDIYNNNIIYISSNTYIYK